MSELYCYTEDRKEVLYEETSRVYPDHKKRTITIHREYPFTLSIKHPKVKVLKLVFEYDEAEKLSTQLAAAFLAVA